MALSLLTLAGLAVACSDDPPVGQPDAAGSADGSDGAPADSLRDGAPADSVFEMQAGDAGGSSMTLAGSWYSRLPDTEAGRGARYRLRFQGNAYQLVSDTPRAYCAETGTFQMTGTGVHFQPGYIAGFGPCTERSAQTEAIVWKDGGFVLQSGGVSLAYAPVRGVPKVFVTVETHDGDLAGDASLPGANAIEKADGICNRSIARPDQARYRAVLGDGVHRGIAPQNDWPLEPLTTYFLADGASNVFTTDAQGTLDNPQHTILVGDSAARNFWLGLSIVELPPETCSGWTSKDPNMKGSTGNLSAATIVSNNTMSCDSLDQPFLCVGEGQSLLKLASPPHSENSSAELAGLQGSWQWSGQLMRPGFPSPDRVFHLLRIEASNYRLIRESASRYCGEIGKVQVMDGRLRLLPDRQDGIEFCEIGDVRTADMRLEGSTLSLTSDGRSAMYRRVPDVPKIFVTFERHSGDFAGDATLPGNGPFEKADIFCNRSTARPDAQSYKAVLVDGVKRNAVPAIDWVLKPSTTYFYGDGVNPVLQTDAMAHQPLNAAKPLIRGGGKSSSPWSGLSRLDFTTTMDTCNGWTSAGPEVRGGLSDWSSFGAALLGRCLRPSHVICVAQ